MNRDSLYKLVPIYHRIRQTGRVCSRFWNKFDRVVHPALSAYTTRKYDRPLTRDKTPHGDEFFAYTDRGLCEIERALDEHGYKRDLSTLKYLTEESALVEEGRVYEVLSRVKHQENGRQQHVFIFDIDGLRYIFHHEEDSYLHDPAGHEDGSNQIAGDPDGTLEEALTGLNLHPPAHDINIHEDGPP